MGGERDRREQGNGREEEGREPGQAASGRKEREEGEEGVAEREVEEGGQDNATGDRV